MSKEPGSITSLVNELRLGVEPKAGPALAAMYDALTTLARDRVRRLAGALEIRTGDLVHEAYLKLFGRPSEHPWELRRHFYGGAGRAMQQVIVDLVRRQRVRRSGNPRAAAPVVVLPAPFENRPVDELVKALARLEEVDAPAAELVRLRYFVGLGMEDAARVLDMPLRSAERKWMVARAWLLRAMPDLSSG